MPNLSKCKTVCGKLCCWDKDKKSFFFVELKPLTNKTELSSAIAVFMEENENVKNINSEDK